MSVKIIGVLLLCIVYTNAFEDCGSKSGSVASVKVSNCNEDDAKCVLKRNTNVTIDINFTSNVNSDTLKAIVHGVVLGVPVPFDLPNPDACKDCNVKCPISSGQNYQYRATLPVLGSYPRVVVDVKWELQDKDGNDVVCILIPAQIKK